MDNQDFLTLLKQHEDNLKGFIAASGKLTHAKMINEVDRVTSQVNEVNLKVDHIIQHQEWQNGKLGKHGKAIVELEKKDISFEQYQKFCPANKVAAKLSKKWVWGVIVASVVVISVTSVWMYHNIDWLKTFERRTGIELVRDQ